MAIPKEIREITRPKSTVVRMVNNTYYVYKRTSVNVEGKKYPQPVELGCVGKIENNVFVPNYEYLRHLPISYKDYGNVKFLDNVSRDLLIELQEVYDTDTANRLYAIAMIRVLYDQVISHVSDYYNESYLSILIPNLSLSENTVSDFLHQIGLRPHLRNKFISNRASRVKHHILIDGMLKPNESKTNTYSAFSRKARIKGYEEISIVYAYDYQRKEPIGAKVWAGNILDKKSFIDTIKEFNIKNGLIIADKGYIKEENIKELSAANIKYLLPLQNNSLYIKNYIYGKVFTNTFKCGEEVISGLKVNLRKRRYLYSFRNEAIRAIDSKAYMDKVNRGVEGYTLESYEKDKDSFGLIVFYSNYNSTLENVYTCYDERWDIECMFRCYKNTLQADTISVQEDTKLQATEFINLLSIIMECRVKEIMKKKDIYNKIPVNYLLEILRRLKATTDDNKTWKLTNQTEKDTKIYRLLNVI